MNNLEVAMMKRYASRRNLDRIFRLAPEAKITLFDIRRSHLKLFLVREVFRRILPYTVYTLFPEKLDELCEKQKLKWIHSPANSANNKTVLLFPPVVEPSVAEELQYRLNPSWIHSIATGIDRLPSIPESTLITSPQGLHSIRVAEFTMALIFALAKNLPEHINLNRKKVWKALPSKMISGAKVGIVGLGKIGKEIAKICKACGMKVWATKRNVNSYDFVDRLLPPAELHNMLREVDYVVLAVPLIEETRNLIGKAEFEMMKSTACLINICRGAVVDEDSLYDALKHKRIRGACIDVFLNERQLPKNSRFYKLSNILITSWSAWYSDESDDQRMDLFFNNLERFIVGKPLLNIADKSQLTHNNEAFT
jgi:phosphoglycerate dehydrogenase-like enzyme